MAYFKRFLSQNSGSVVMIVAVMLVLILGVMMITVDLSRVQSGKTNNQSAIDAAALSAAEYVTRYRVENKLTGGEPKDIKETALKVFLQNLALDQTDSQLETKKNTDGTTVQSFDIEVGPQSLKITACVTVKTSIAATIGQGDSKTVCNVSAASIPMGGGVEIVFALDMSTSMLEKYPDPINGNQKLKALKDSINNLMDYYAGGTSIYWGVVPYTGVVDLGGLSENIVAEDFTGGQPSDLLQPAALKFADGTTYKFDYKFDGLEDQVTQGLGGVFDDTNYKPPTYQYALKALKRFPLTARVGQDPLDSSSIKFDDARPEGSGQFLAYWHQPYDFYMEYDRNATEGACGVCIDQTGERYISVKPGTDIPFDTGACKGETPQCPTTGCVTPPYVPPSGGTSESCGGKPCP